MGEGLHWTPYPTPENHNSFEVLRHRWKELFILSTRTYNCNMLRFLHIFGVWGFSVQRDGARSAISMGHSSRMLQLLASRDSRILATLPEVEERNRPLAQTVHMVGKYTVGDIR